MSNQDLKLSIIQLVGEVEDTNILESVQFLLSRFVPKDQEAGIVAYTTGGQPLTLEAFEQSILGASEQIKAGQSMKQKDVETLLSSR